MNIIFLYQFQQAKVENFLMNCDTRASVHERYFVDICVNELALLTVDECLRRRKKNPQ